MPDKPFSEIQIPQIDIEAQSAFTSKPPLILDDQTLKPSLRYQDWWEVNNLNGGSSPPVGNVDAGTSHVATSWEFTEMIMLRDALCTHSDTFKSEDDSKLALAIATTGLSNEIGKLLTKQDSMANIFKEIIPIGNVRNQLSSRLQLLTYNQVMEETRRMLNSASASTINSAVPTQRQYLLFILTELLVRVGGAFIGIQRRRDITIHRPVFRLFPTKEDLVLFMQASFIKVALTNLAASIAAKKPRSPEAMPLVLQKIADTLLSFGRELQSVSYTSDALQISLGVVKWYLSSPLVPDFPPEMKTNANLISLSGNATFVKMAMEAAPTTVMDRLSFWAWSMEQVVKAIKDPAYFRTMRLSEFEGYCGLAHIQGARLEIKGSLFWMNLPASAPVLAYEETEITASTRIGEVNPRPDVDGVMKTLTTSLLRMDGSAWAAELQAYLKYCIEEEATGLPGTREEDTRIEKKKVTRDPGPHKNTPIFIRFAAPEEAVWYYACARLRQVYPRFVGVNQASSVSYDFIVPVEDVNVNLTIPIFQGKIRTPDPKIALIGLEGHPAQSSIPLLTDGLPEQDKDGLLYLDQIPRYDDFNRRAINRTVVPTRIPQFVVNVKNWLTHASLPNYEGIKLTEMTRTKLLLNVWDQVINAVNVRIHETFQSRWYLARMRAYVLKDLMADTSTALSIHHGFLITIINRIGEPLARAEIEGDFNKSTMLTRMLCRLGGEILIQTGLVAPTLTTPWFDLLDEMNWYAIEGSTNTWARQYGLKK